MLIRRYQPEDLVQIVRLFYETVHTVNRKDYSAEQVRVWAGKKDRLLDRAEFFDRLYTLVAVEGGQIAGYGNIDSTGYLDHLFVHKDYQRKNVATMLCDELEKQALLQGTPLVTVHASITAKPFFEQRGYQVLKQQQVLVEGIALTNYVMEKQLMK